MKLGRVVHELDMAGEPAGLEVELKLEGGSDAVLAAHGTLLARADGVARLRVDGEARLPALASALVQEGARLYAMTPKRRSLEATFLEVMGEDQRPG
jgi:hypothetical protein